ncbi:MAG: hypothetical protein JSS86_22115, partial [Cyanobacteria bacterium SZAS LIN-2]|nr:hypothetical protein [Cyanobacteria bacterium SZAS LIN-2]
MNRAKVLLARGLPDPFSVQFNSAERKQRVLHFPEYSLGEIVISALPDDFEHAVRGAAKGTIVVPAGKYCTFVPAHRFFLNPSIIKTFPPDAFECVWLSALSLADEEDGLCDRALAQIGHLKGLIELNLDKSDATDAGLVHASELPELQKITGFQATIRGACLAHFGGLKKLHYLRLPSSWMQDENLKYAATLPNLTALSLAHAGVSDKGVKKLVGCNHLLSLDLADSPKVTDESVKAIAAIKSLRYLNLDGTS